MPKTYRRKRTSTGRRLQKNTVRRCSHSKNKKKGGVSSRKLAAILFLVNNLQNVRGGNLDDLLTDADRRDLEQKQSEISIWVEKLSKEIDEAHADANANADTLGEEQKIDLDAAYEAVKHLFQ